MCAFINRAVLKNLFTLVCLWKSIRIKNKNIEDSTCVSCDTHYESAKTQAVMYSHFVWYSGKKESYKTSNTFTSWNYSITFVIASLPLIQWGSVMCNILPNVVDFIETDKRLKKSLTTHLRVWQSPKQLVSLTKLYGRSPNQCILFCF